MRNGEQIKAHLHSTCPYTYLSGHVTVKCENSSTFYINPINQINDPEVYESKNSVGKLTFFQSNIPHYTSVHDGQSERITIAFNIIVDEDYMGRPNKEVYVLFDEGEV
jgi:ABC-type oligopeptide transport system ATPase subunit